MRVGLGFHSTLGDLCQKPRPGSLQARAQLADCSSSKLASSRQRPASVHVLYSRHSKLAEAQALKATLSGPIHPAVPHRGQGPAVTNLQNSPVLPQAGRSRRRILQGAAQKLLSIF
eukprot:359876-Chlamydomonas_euryale.AAC.3